MKPSSLLSFLCRTRWVDALEVLVELYPAIVQSLHDIAYREDSVSWNRDTINDANGLLSAIEKFSFLLTLIVVFNALSYIKGLTVLLQQRSLDIVRGIELVRDLQEQMKELHEEIDDWHIFGSISYRCCTRSGNREAFNST